MESISCFYNHFGICTLLHDFKESSGVRGLTENIIVNKTHWQPIVSSTIFFHAAMLTHCMLWWGRGESDCKQEVRKLFFYLPPSRLPAYLGFLGIHAIYCVGISLSTGRG